MHIRVNTYKIIFKSVSVVKLTYNTLYERKAEKVSKIIILFWKQVGNGKPLMEGKHGHFISLYTIFTLMCFYSINKLSFMYKILSMLIFTLFSIINIYNRVPQVFIYQPVARDNKGKWIKYRLYAYMQPLMFNLRQELLFDEIIYFIINNDTNDHLGVKQHNL
jgi:hypothetical protein